MTNTTYGITASTEDLPHAKRERETRFLRLQTLLRKQRARMQTHAQAEFQQVVEAIAYRLKADDQSDLIAYHVREVWQRFVLDLPEHWQKNMARYVRKDVMRDPWFRAPMAEQAPLTPEQIREFAKFLVASRRPKQLHTETPEVKHG